MSMYSMILQLNDVFPVISFERAHDEVISGSGGSGRDLVWTLILENKQIH